jgi:excisionase family DNA binding protein
MATKSNVEFKRLLSVREASQFLGLQPDTVYRRSRRGLIPSVRLGRELRFDVRALEKLIEAHTVQPAGPDAGGPGAHGPAHHPVPPE